MYYTLLYYRLSTNALKPFPKTKLVVIFVLTYQSIADELYAMHDKAVIASAVEEAYLSVYKRIVGDIQSAGFTTICIATADKAHLKGNPMVSSLLSIMVYF